MNWAFLAEVSGAVVAGLWAIAYAIAGIRYLRNGPDVPEVVNAAFIVKYTAKAASERWYHRALTGLDIFVNLIFRGQPDETLSSRAYRASLEKKLWGRIMTYWLELMQVQHGIKAIVGDLYRATNRIAYCKKILGVQ